MTKDKKVMQQALEALENAVRYHGIMLMADPPQDAWKYHRVEDNAKQAITALREALAQPVQPEQPEQEPVAYDKTEMNSFVIDLYDLKMREGKHGHYEALFHCVHQAIARVNAPAAQPVQPEQRKPLTDEQVKELLLIGPVYAPDGVVTRTPFAYRKELLDTALWALRKAEAAHNIGVKP